MKYLIETTSSNLDILLVDRFVAGRKEGNEIEWHNKEAGIAKGKTTVEAIIVYQTENHDFGQPSVNKVWINAVDIKAIYERMLEIEKITTGHERDDLPF